MGRQGFTFTPAFSFLGLFWFLSPVNTQSPSSGGTCPTETLGREFVTSYMENCGNSAQFEVEITGYLAFSSVSISVSNQMFKKIVVNQGEVTRVQLQVSVGVNASSKFNKTVVVKADKDISVVSVIHRHQSLETIVLYPVSSWGREYYLVTPFSESSDRELWVTVMTYEENKHVTIQASGKLRYDSSDHQTGFKLTFFLEHFQGYHFKGITDLSGTKIVSEKPVAVLVAETCSCNNTKCNDVFEQLLPTCSWGTTYIIPPLPRQDINDTVYIMASQNTTVLYQLGGEQENVFLANGTARQFPVKLSSPVFISANVSLQVLYYSRGPAIPDHSHTFLMRVPDVASYCRMYSLNYWKDFKNFALVVASTSETGAIIIDSQPVSGVVWNQVPGTEFSWGKYEFGTDKGSHTVEHPSSSFGLLRIGVSDVNSYSIPGSCRKNVFPSECIPEILQTTGHLERCRKALQGELNSSSSESELCSFMNLTFAKLETTCARNTTVKDVTHQFDTLLDDSTHRVVGSKSKEVVASAAVTLLLQSVELAALAAALRSPKTIQNATTQSLAIETRLIKVNCSQNEVFNLRAGKERMDIRSKTITTQSREDLQAVAFISYTNLTSVFGKGFLNKEDTMVGKKLKNCRLNSKVVSGVVGGDKLKNLPEPVNFTLCHEKLKKEEEMVFCVYWNFTAGKGTWTTEGCKVLHTDNNRTICSCDHLSSFALLMGLTTEEENVPLTIITYVGLTFSVLCLFLAILTFLLCRSIRNVSTTIHLQLCLCLFLADLLFLTAVNKAKHKKSPEVTCAVIAGFLHYLFLACFTWMFLEGLHLFLTVRNLKVVNYTSASRFKKRYMYPFGYGFPALIVAVSAAVNPNGYGTKNLCWLSMERGFLWSFLGPVCAIILINLTFFIVTLWILRSKLSSLNEGVSTIKDTRLLTFKAIAQLFILGCTWSLGLFQFGPLETVMAYLFTIVNSLQGAFIFLVHCLLNRQVRDEYRRWIKSTKKPSPTTHTSDLSMSATTHNTKMAGHSDDGIHRRAAWDSGTAESSGLSVTS